MSVSVSHLGEGWAVQVLRDPSFFLLSILPSLGCDPHPHGRVWRWMFQPVGRLPGVAPNTSTYTLLAVTQHVAACSCKGTGKQSLYSGRPHTSPKFKGSVIEEEKEKKDTGEQLAVFFPGVVNLLYMLMC